MKRKKRLLNILEEVDIRGKVRVSTLADKLQVSEMTIRKDLNFLSQENLLRRTYGGAEKCAEHFYKRSIKSDLFIKASAKIMIAKTAYEEIENHHTVIMDGSSTCVYLARIIKENKEKSIVLITNSILVANEVLEASHVNLILLGGNVQRNLASTEGESVMEELRKQRGDICFFSSNGIDVEKGITVVDYEQMLIKKAMIKNSKKVCMLADSSKLGKSYASEICAFQDIWKIIISSGGNKEETEKLKGLTEKNVHVV